MWGKLESVDFFSGGGGWAGIGYSVGATLVYVTRTLYHKKAVIGEGGLACRNQGGAGRDPIGQPNGRPGDPGRAVGLTRPHLACCNYFAFILFRSWHRTVYYSFFFSVAALLPSSLLLLLKPSSACCCAAAGWGGASGGPCPAWVTRRRRRSSSAWPPPASA